MMKEIEQLIREYVMRNNQEYSEHSIYNECVEDMSKVDLQTITEQDVVRIIKRFLIKWGTMQRVLGEKTAPEWGKRLADLIRANSQRLNDLKIVDLSDVEVELGKYETEIKDCYESFKEVVKPVAAAKVLHLICTNFFPPWDNAIRDAAWNEDIEVAENSRVIELPEDYYQLHKQQIEAVIKNFEGKKKGGPKKFSAADYYRFMQFVQNFIRTYKTTLSPLATEYRKNIVKIADDCFWLATRRPLYLFCK